MIRQDECHSKVVIKIINQIGAEYIQQRKEFAGCFIIDPRSSLGESSRRCSLVSIFQIKTVTFLILVP